MTFIRIAGEAEVQTVFDLTHETIEAVYPLYYPRAVVDFFHQHHALEKVARDIKAGLTWLIIENDTPVGTGSIHGQEISRFFILPQCQQQGKGAILLRHLEEKIAQTFSTATLDASLPAQHFYQHKGYHCVSNERIEVSGGAFLCYAVMEKDLAVFPAPINYDGRRFVSVANEEHGEVSEETRFDYHQKENMLWADYSGGSIRKGFLIGTVAEDGSLAFHYQHLNHSGALRLGHCVSTPELLPDGRIRLHESWQWLDGEKQTGHSLIEEVSG